MNASIIIITKNQKEYMRKTIPILKKQKFKGRYEIIVVDSGSTDGAREYCVKQKVKVVDIAPETFNYANAFNTGAKLAKGKYLVRLSGDCVPLKTNWLTEIVKPFSDAKVGGTFGKYVISGRKGYGYPEYWPATRFPNKSIRYTVKPFTFMGIGISYWILGKKVFEFAGGNCAIRKTIWLKRPLNENLPSGEDAEYAWFLHTTGFDIEYNSRAEALHEHKTDIKRNQYKLLGISKPQVAMQTVIWSYWIKRILGYDNFANLHFQ